MTYDLVIFDCDGTLVNSEYMYNAVTAELLNEIGYQEYTPELCLELFVGQSWSTITAELEVRHQEKMPEDLVERFVRLAEQRLTGDVPAVPEAQEAIEIVSRTHAVCVASNGERSAVFKSLNVTGLMRFFDESRVFTKIQVPRPKPAPDLFLYACAQMGVAPDRVLVIEDSVTGVRAAKAGQIAVIGFVGTAHDPAKQAKNLRDAGAYKVIERLIHIPECLEA